MPAMRKRVVYFVSRPMPRAAPMASHQREFSDLSRRMRK